MKGDVTMMTSDVLAMTARPAVMAFQDLDSAELALVEGGAIPPTMSDFWSGVAVGAAVGAGVTVGVVAILIAVGGIIIVA
jgi:hypothetical protein